MKKARNIKMLLCNDLQMNLKTILIAEGEFKLKIKTILKDNSVKKKIIVKALINQASN